MGKMLGALTLAVALFVGTAVKAGATESIDELQKALSGGKISGTVGNYMEYVDKQAIDSNYGWGTAYVELKYKTLEWNRLSAAVGFLAHGDVYNESDNPSFDAFDADIETKVSVPELYLSGALLEKSSLTVGRFDHRKISHIDDNQTEGAYFSFAEMKNLTFIGGFMRRFAELDYDDGENFGRNNDSQDLSSETTFGSNSDPYMLWLETKYQPLECLSLNPYLMTQDGYASVYGMDTTPSLKAGEGVYGTNVYAYYVDSKQTTTTDATAWSVAPFVKLGPVDVLVGYADFDEGNAFNRPTWLVDYFLPLDQIIGYGLPGSEVYFGKVRYAIGKFWTHFAMGQYSHDFSAANGDGIKEYEVQFGYNLTKNIALNLRLFDVNYDHVSNKDYQKVETLITFKF